MKISRMSQVKKSKSVFNIPAIFSNTTFITFIKNYLSIFFSNLYVRVYLKSIMSSYLCSFSSIPVYSLSFSIYSIISRFTSFGNDEFPRKRYSLASIMLKISSSTLYFFLIFFQVYNFLIISIKKIVLY